MSAMVVCCVEIPIAGGETVRFGTTLPADHALVAQFPDCFEREQPATIDDAGAAIVAAARQTEIRAQEAREMVPLLRDIRDQLQAIVEHCEHGRADRD
jgi:hypothetical protein